MMSKNVLIISGEPSGDLHGSSLIEGLKRLVPGIRLKGMGGERMLAAGLDGFDSTPIAVVGIIEVIEKFPLIRKAYNSLKGLLASEDFDCVILIDYPDFNLRFASEAKKRGVPVIYYISPQVWAWRSGRIKLIARLVDKMIVVFPFEEPLYRGLGVDCEYVGHPLVDRTDIAFTSKEARSVLGVPAEMTTVALLAGSRSAEVKRLLRPMVEAVGIVAARLARPLKVLIPAAPGIEDSLIQGILGESAIDNPIDGETDETNAGGNAGIDISIIRGRTYEALRAADAALTASGTATLETALIGTPMVIAYKVSLFSYLVARLMIRLDSIGLPNIVSAREVVPELIQFKATARAMAEELYSILTDTRRRTKIVEDLAKISDILGGPGASERAAEAVAKFLAASGRPGETGERMTRTG